MNLRTLVALGLLVAGASLALPAASAACVPVNAGPVITGNACVTTRTGTLASGGWNAIVIGPGAFNVPNPLPAAFCQPVNLGPAFTGNFCVDRTSDPLAQGGWNSVVIGPGAFRVPNVLP